MSEVDEIRIAYQNLHKMYDEQLPKVKPTFIDNLLQHQMADPSDDPIFLIEVFTKPGLDPQRVRRYIIEKTGMAPEIYDHGTHYVTNQKLNLKILKEISDSDDVLEVTGEYTGRLGGYGASHEHREEEDTQGAARGRGEPPS